MWQMNCPQTLSLSYKASGDSGTLVLDGLCNRSPVTGTEVSSSGSESVLCSLASSRPVIKSGGEESPNREPPLPPARELPQPTAGHAILFGLAPLFASHPAPHTPASQGLCSWGAAGNLWTRKSGSGDEDNENSWLLCPQPLSVTPCPPVPPAPSRTNPEQTVDWKDFRALLLNVLGRG